MSISHDEAAAGFAAIKARIQAQRAAREATTTHRPQNTSLRTPQYDTHHNEADNLERGLLADGHCCWGFVVYRTTYTDNESWRVCCERIRTTVHDSLSFYNGLDLMAADKFELTIIDEPQFNRVEPNAVREHFWQWRAEALHQEQGSDEEIAARRQRLALPNGSLTVRHPTGSLAVRYRFCLQIDQDSLESIIGAGGYGDAWVRIINCDAMDDRNDKEEDDKDDSDDSDENPEDRRMREEEEVEERSGYPELEGSRAKDVKWMKVQLDGLMPGFYHRLHDEYAWDQFFQRPPTLANT